MGLIGAAVYYWRHAEEGLGSDALALGKALVWPASVVYDVLKHTSGGTPVERGREVRDDLD